MPKGRDTYVTVQPDGSILFDFPGHISAQGVDLIAGDVAAPPNDRRIRWHKTTMNGAVVAEVFGYSNPTNDHMIMRATSPDGTGTAELDLFASNTAAVTPSQALISLDGGIAQALILDVDGESSFVRDGSTNTRRLRIFGPYISPGQFLVPGGILGINFNHATGVMPGVYLGHIGGGNGIVWSNTAQDVNNFTIACYNASPANQNFVWAGFFITEA